MSTPVQQVERCLHCNEPTGRAGMAEDSLYMGDAGPFCEACFQPVIGMQQELTDLRARCEKAEKDAERWQQWVSLQTGDIMSLVMDAERFNALIAMSPMKAQAMFWNHSNIKQFVKTLDAAIAKERT